MSRNLKITPFIFSTETPSKLTSSLISILHQLQNLNVKLLDLSGIVTIFKLLILFWGSADELLFNPNSSVITEANYFFKTEKYSHLFYILQPLHNPYAYYLMHFQQLEIIDNLYPIYT